MDRAADASLVRSWLFCPATRPERIEKAEASGADAVVVDLEDAIPPDEKDVARAQAMAALVRRPSGPVVRCLRPNGMRTPHGLRDLLALLDAAAVPEFLVVPKVESAGELGMLDALFADGPCAAMRFLPLVETARGLAAAEEIAAQPRVAGLVLGGADLAADLGAEIAWEPLLFARARLVHAAATAAIACIDVPHLVLADDAALADETRRIGRLGFTGKLAIHPRQVEPIHAAFAPSASEVAAAGRVLAAVEAAAGGVTVVDGRMVDVPLVRAARRTLARAARAGR